jgi:hypothetical protein
MIGLRAMGDSLIAEIRVANHFGGWETKHESDLEGVHQFRAG